MGVILSNSKHKHVTIGAAHDIIQSAGGKCYQTPEIRVWCHPHEIGKSGSDYYKVFKTFPAAEKFIKTHKEAEKDILLAFRGYEIDIYALTDRNLKKD